MPRTVISFFLFVHLAAVSQIGLALDRQIDPRLDKTLSDFARYNEIRFDSLDDGVSEIKKALADLTQLRVSPCELQSELYAKVSRDPKRIEYVLRDLVDEKTRQIKLGQELILQRLATQRRLDDADRKAVFSLAVQVASQSNSMTELRESIIPKMFDGIEAKLGRIPKVEEKIDILDLQLRKRIDSICDRLAKLEEAENRRANEGDRYAMNRPAVLDRNPSVLPPEQPRASVQWRSVNGTSWEPEAYATSEQLCSNPTPGPKNVYFDRGVHTERGVVQVRSYGDMWQNCDGRIVMVTSSLDVD